MVRKAITSSLKFGKVVERTVHHWKFLRQIEKRGDSISADVHREVATTWARECLRAMNVRPHVTGKIAEEPVLLLGNHLSYVDIPLLMSQDDVTFIAKRQLKTWPIFGKAITIAGTIYVDRDSKDSRRSVGSQVAPMILEQNKRVVIFPSGTTSLDESKPWRWGPFQIAREFGIRVQPFRLRYHPLRAVAFIEADWFATHLWQLMTRPHIDAYLEFHEPVKITHPEEDALKWQAWARASLNESR